MIMGITPKKSKNISPTYVRVFRYRAKAKNAQMRESMLLLQGAELSFTENCNSVTDFSNDNPTANQGLSAKTMTGPLGCA
jgi:hypothetical protein